MCLKYEYWNLDLKNSVKIAYQRGTENNGFCTLLLVDISLTLPKAAQNLIININKTCSFKFYTFSNEIYLYSLGKNCAPLVTDLFLHACEANFFQELPRIQVEN